MSVEVVPGASPSPGAEPRGAARFWPWALAVVVAVAAVPRVMDALRTRLIFDEIYGIVFARLGVVKLLQRLSEDVDQPLNFIVIWAWRLLGGEGDRWIKIPALLFGLGTVVVAALLGRRLFGPVAALVGALLLAVHSTHVQFSQEARFHSMVWFFLAAATLSAWRWLEREPGRPGLVLVLAGAAALYTDHFSSFVLTGIALAGLWSVRRDRRRLLAWLGLFGVIVLLFAPQIPTLVVQLRRDIEGERLLPPMSPREMGELLRKLSFNVRYLVPPLMVLAVLPLMRGATRRPAVFAWTVLLYATLMPWALSQAGIHLFLYRQMLFAIPLWCLLIAAGATGLRRAWLAAPLTAVLVGVAARSCMLRSPTEETVTLPQAVEVLRAATRPGDLVLATETRAHLHLRYYLPDRDSRLLIMPQTEPFHYSDGILAIPPEWQIGPEEWHARTAANPHWWGLRLQHAGRDGPDAAAALDSAAAGGTRRFGRATVWFGAPVP